MTTTRCERHGQTEIGIISHEGRDFDSPNLQVWNQPNHNWLRITRVLRSLNLLGLSDEAQPFFALLTTIRPRIDPTTWGYWEGAACTET